AEAAVWRNPLFLPLLPANPADWISPPARSLAVSQPPVSARHEGRQRVHHGPIVLLLADGDAQVVGQAVVGQAAHQDAASGQEVLGCSRRALAFRREAHQYEIALRGQDLQPQAADLLGQPWAPARDELPAALLEVLVAEGRHRRE